MTSRGQVTLRKEILQHLGIASGGKLEVEMMPDGHARLKAARPAKRIEDIFGMLAGKTNKVATVDEINDAVEAGWAGER